MKPLSLAGLDIEIGDEVALSDGGRLVRASWGTRATKRDIDLANHNVFRLDAQGEVVWRVERDERGHMNWEVLHEHAKRKHTEGAPDGCYGPEGFWDPFRSLGMDERQAQSPEPKGIYRPGCVVYLVTRWWEYVLDVETGIAACTGDQVK